MDRVSRWTPVFRLQPPIDLAPRSPDILAPMGCTAILTVY